VTRIDRGELGKLCDAAPAGDGALVFFDTETTSLATGAGVYVFLVGFAWAEIDRFVVEQLYLSDPSAERDLLCAAGERIRSAPLLVSFAGRGFDEHRLEDRFRCARLPSPFVRSRHADVYPLARSLWGGRLDSCALGVLEAARLGFARTNDLPGEACPDAYFRSLRGDRDAAEAVLRHNVLDLLSTAVLAAELAERAATTADPAELLGLGLHHRRRGRCVEALAHFGRAEAEDARTGALRHDERRALALEAAALLKRLGRHDEAAERWRRWSGGPTPSIEALVELAKHAEHRSRDLPLAARCAAEALSLVRRRHVELTDARRAALDVELVRRLSRIEDKIARAERTIELP
jgi:uncharacterized protein YprB with RNaseH-like and TPR domain